FSLSRWSGGLVAHYGARMPLMIGPFIVALGFLLFTLPSTGASYWRSFFPAFLILGFGMAVSVAPLTTVVMSSVEQERAGTASGINNAVARLAGVLAIAVLGIVMTWAFNHRLESSLAGLDLQPDVNQAIQSNSIKLAGLEVPRNLDPTTAASVRSAVLESFIFGFRLVMAICALLAVASGLQSAAGPFAPRRRATSLQSGEKLSQPNKVHLVHESFKIKQPGAVGKSRSHSAGPTDLTMRLSSVATFFQPSVLVGPQRSFSVRQLT